MCSRGLLKKTNCFFCCLEQAVLSATGGAGLSKSPSSAPSIPPTGLQNHSFYRLPRADSVVPAVCFDGRLALQSTTEPKHLAKKLLLLREVFAQDRVSSNNINLLVLLANDLLNYAAQLHPTDLEGNSPAQVVMPVARRFLLADALWCICEVVGPSMKKDQWWNLFISNIKITESVVEQRRVESNSWRPLIGRLRDAVELFGQGVRPTPQEIVHLKRAIFCGPNIPPRFKNREWHPWRKDDENYRRGSGGQ